MAEQVRGQGGPGGEIGADRRVAAIEARVNRLVEAYRRGRRQMLVIALLVIALFGVFTLATTWQVKDNLRKDRLRDAVVARAPAVQPDLERHLTDVARDVLPVYREQAVARFKEVGPEVSQIAMERLKTLPADASKQIEEQLQVSRDRVLARIEPELAARYPSLTDERKKEILATYFHEKIGAENEQLASKLDAIRTSETIKVDAVLEKFGVGAEPPASRPRERERQFLHALVDVLMDSDLTTPIVPAAQPAGTASARLVSAGESDLGEMPTTALTTQPSAPTAEPAAPAPQPDAPVPAPAPSE